jgi:hypothetical protein
VGADLGGLRQPPDGGAGLDTADPILMPLYGHGRSRSQSNAVSVVVQPVCVDLVM